MEKKEKSTINVDYSSSNVMHLLDRACNNYMYKVVNHRKSKVHKYIMQKL